jgi:spoIIIJ-associated protein
MTGFLGKIFGGGGSKKSNKKDGVEGLVEDLLGQVVQMSRWDLSFDVSKDDNGEVNVNFSGGDDEMLIEKEGALLDALQLFVRRGVQHQMPDERGIVNLDCADFRAQANEALVELAEKLKGIALAKGKSVYFRALPPKDRKVIHQYLAEDGRVKSRSIGDGHFKKIKIYPVKGSEIESDQAGEKSDADMQREHDEVFQR